MSFRPRFFYSAPDDERLRVWQRRAQIHAALSALALLAAGLYHLSESAPRAPEPTAEKALRGHRPG